MSMTAVPISIFFVRAPTAARSGNGEPSWRAKWCTRKYAPSSPSSSAATASSIDCRRAFDAVRTSEWGDGVQCPNERKPIFFTQGTSERNPQRIRHMTVFGAAGVLVYLGLGGGTRPVRKDETS